MAEKCATRNFSILFKSSSKVFLSFFFAAEWEMCLNWRCKTQIHMMTARRWLDSGIDYWKFIWCLSRSAVRSFFNRSKVGVGGGDCKAVGRHALPRGSPSDWRPSCWPGRSLAGWSIFWLATSRPATTNNRKSSCTQCDSHTKLI